MGDVLLSILAIVLVGGFFWLAIMGWKRRHMLFHQSKFACEVVMHDYQAADKRAAMEYVMEERDMAVEEDSGLDPAVRQE